LLKSVNCEAFRCVAVRSEANEDEAAWSYFKAQARETEENRENT